MAKMRKYTRWTAEYDKWMLLDLCYTGLTAVKGDGSTEVCFTGYSSFPQEVKECDSLLDLAEDHAIDNETINLERHWPNGTGNPPEWRRVE